jgi:hypothetical protein
MMKCHYQKIQEHYVQWHLGTFQCFLKEKLEVNTILNLSISFTIILCTYDTEEVAHFWGGW